MRFRMTAKAQGDGEATAGFQCVTGEFRVGVEVDPGTRRMTEVWVEAGIPDYREYISGFAPGPYGGLALDVRLPPVRDSLVALLQFVESLGNFWMGIDRVDWRNARLSWEPDSEAEERELRLRSIQLSAEYPPRRIPLLPDVLARLLANRDALQYLVIPMSFVREADLDYRHHRYVRAFYGFYFFLEDLYGEGKTKNRQVLDAFRDSAQLTAAVEAARSEFDEPANHALRAELHALCARLGCATTADGLLEFLVMMRGELHHFSQRSTRPKGHPLNEVEFRSVAYLAMVVCITLIQQLANGAPLD